MAGIDALEPALILHTRPYRDTSLLVDFLTCHRGRICAVARGAKRQKSPWRSILQPFAPLFIAYFGRHELHTLKIAELQGLPIPLKGRKLLSAFYLNELLIRLLQRHDPYPDLYALYLESLEKLSEAENIERVLRRFEFSLLNELGYGVQLDRVNISHANLEPQAWYHFSSEAGVQPVLSITEVNQGSVFRGENLLAIARQDFSSAEILSDAKRLSRLALKHLLGDKPLHSRQLFWRQHHEICE